MATTTATLTLSSTDLLSDELALNTTATLTAAGNSTGLTAAIGLSRITISDTSETTLFDASAYTDDSAHKMYIKNTSVTAAQYLLIKVGGTELGRLYAGDFLFAPWGADTTSTDCDVTATPSHSGMTIEYMAFID
tara:strand:- start:2265 stop:2669 length:405 start_codon:yes stop_codon:yes gene_type:complete